MPTLHSKTILITGASRGIGLAIAKTFAAHHARRLILVGRHEATLSEAVAAITTDSHSFTTFKPSGTTKDKDNIYDSDSDSDSHKTCEITTQVGNVSQRGFWQEEMRSELKEVDILVNAAGITHSSLLVATKTELIQDLLDTNLTGTVWACQAVAKAMMRQRRQAENTGCIINVSSLLGVKGGKGSTVYSASKAGVIGLTRSLSLELAQANVRVNAIIPGYIETQMTKDMDPTARSIAMDAIPQKRFGTPEEVAYAALFLATNAYANNCHLNLDGGLSAT